MYLLLSLIKIRQNYLYKHNESIWYSFKTPLEIVELFYIKELFQKLSQWCVEFTFPYESLPAICYLLKLEIIH